MVGGHVRSWSFAKPSSPCAQASLSHSYWLSRELTRTAVGRGTPLTMQQAKAYHTSSFQSSFLN